MSWTDYVAALRAIPEAERLAALAEFRDAIKFKDDFCSDPRQKALAKQRLTNKIRAIEESLS